MVMVALRDRTVMETEQEDKVRIHNERKRNLMCVGGRVGKGWMDVVCNETSCLSKQKKS